MDDVLTHYGILGMKWGVRRYQNYDGSYTKKGLERYNKANKAYQDAKTDHKLAKEAYKSGAGSKVAVKDAKINEKKMRKDLNKAYEKLKIDNAADKGRRVYQQGTTITDINNKLNTQKKVVGGISIATNLLVFNYLNSAKSMKMAYLGSGAILAGNIAVQTVLDKYANSKIKKLRAYYAH